MKGQRLEQEIRESLDAEVSKVELPRNLLSGVMSRLGEQGRPQRLLRFIPRNRLAWAVVLLSLLLIGGTAYAATSLMGDFFKTLAPDIEDNGLIVKLDLSQTIDGVTVRLVQGYADSNTILIGYTVTGRNARYSTDALHLSLADGQNLSASGGLGYVPTLNLLGWQTAETTEVMAFDASAVEGGSAEINLRFETTVGDSPSIETSSVTWGPFAFDFTLPFHAGKTVIVNQTTEAAGVPITLEKVVITPSATGAVLLFHGDYEDNKKRPLPISSLQPSTGSTDNLTGGIKASKTWFPEAFTLETYPGDFTNRSGGWTLTITELVFVPRRPEGQSPVYYGKAADVKRLAGPWVFQFQVP